MRAEGVRKGEWVSVVGENHQQPRLSGSQQRRNTRADETGGPGAIDSHAFTCPAATPVSLHGQPVSGENQITRPGQVQRLFGPALSLRDTDDLQHLGPLAVGERPQPVVRGTAAPFSPANPVSADPDHQQQLLAPLE